MSNIRNNISTQKYPIELGIWEYILQKDDNGYVAYKE